MLSLTCKAAVKAVIFLATLQPEGSRYSIKEIAENINANEHTVGKILQMLVHARIINSIKGPNGGFFIDDSQMNMTLMNVVEAIDGKTIFEKCGIGLSKCSNARPCPVHEEYKIVRDGFALLCRNNKIKDVCRKVNEGDAFLI